MARLHTSRSDVVGVVAVILAIGISTSLILLVVSAYLVRAINGNDADALSENITEVLTGWGGGLIGVLGAYVGFAIGSRRRRRQVRQSSEEPEG